MEWSTQSKAGDMSNRLNTVTYHLSAAFKKSDQTRSIAVSVECPFLSSYKQTGNAAVPDR